MGALGLLGLIGCERDPALFGYWDIVAMRAGPTAADARDVDQAGFLEFAADGSAYGIFSYTWVIMDWEPDPSPDLHTFSTDAVAVTEFIETYTSARRFFEIEIER